MLEIVGEGVLSRDVGRGAYFPSVAILRDGTLLASQHVGSGLCSPDNMIEVLRSLDGGSSWVNEGSIHGGIPDDGWSYRAPVITEVPDGSLIMAATRYRLDNEEIYNPASEGLKPAQMILYRSSDQGVSWLGPEVVPNPLPADRYVCSLSGRILLLSPQRWMYPFETWKPDGYEGPVDQKAGAIFSSDQGRTWGELAVVSDDPEEHYHYGDQMPSLLPDGRIYTLIWTRTWGTQEDRDVRNRWVVSEDQGRTWSEPQPTNLRGQLCAPIPLSDGRVAAIYNYRHEPQGVHVVLTEDLATFDTANEVVVFSAGRETMVGQAVDDFIDKHQKIAFGRPWGRQLPDGALLVYFWCTLEEITHTRWVRLRLT